MSGQLILLSCFFLAGFLTTNAANYNSQSMDFLLAFPDVHIPSGGGIPGSCRVIISSVKGARATVAVPGQSISSSVVITAQSMAVVDLASTIRITAGTTQTLGVTVTATANVDVYAVNQGDKSSDGTLVFPISMLGTEYIVSSFSGSWYGSQVSVVSNTASTTVNLHKPDFINGFILNSSVTLNQYETHMFSSTRVDMTGWKITANKAIAVFSGHSLTEVISISSTANSTSGGLNQYNLHGSQLWEMMPATTYWDTEYVVPPSPNRAKANSIHQMVRVIAKAATTVELTVKNISYTIAQGGEFIQFNSSLDEYEYVTCSVACMVIHYMTDLSYDTSQNTDPSMTVLPPTMGFSDDYILGALYVTATAGSAVNPALFAWDNYVSVVVLTANKGSVSVVGPSGTLSATFVDMTDTDYSLATFGGMTASSAPGSVVEVTCTECMVLMAGLDFSDSYVYIGRWDNKLVASSAIRQGWPTVALCVSLPLSALLLMLNH